MITGEMLRMELEALAGQEQAALAQEQSAQEQARDARNTIHAITGARQMVCHLLAKLVEEDSKPENTDGTSSPAN